MNNSKQQIPFNIGFSRIPMYQDHCISECGKYIVNSRGNVIKQAIQQIKGKLSGYYYATMLAVDYRYFKRVAVHRLVAFTYLGEPPTPHHKWVNHKDGNKANNHYTNLEWTTISENIQHAYNTGLKVSKKGEAHHLYGKEVSRETKSKMSQAKQGAKHPKFKGYYYANFKRFESANQAGKYLGIPAKTIIQRCNNPKFKLKGFYFLPK